MKQFKILNNTLGWLTFIVAATTYCLTVEPTASFWDCPEFILSANKLEVGHPPGAPFFMLTANFFSLFAGPAKVALMVNIMSAILSALGILFMFWSITHLARKLIVGNSDTITTAQTITILASGLVGALAYTWSDTYWFSAVEGEVYGYSSLFTAVVFWLILKWEDNASSPHSDRWLILISYLVGLSIGVHLLNLLCIPAIILVVYYKKFPGANWKGSMLALLISMVLVAIVLYGIVPGVVKVGGWFELLFVNVLGMPFNTGLIIYIILLFAALIAGVVLTEKGKEHKKIALIFTASVALLGIPFYGNSVATSIILGIIVLFIVYQISIRTKEVVQKTQTQGGTKVKNVKKPLVSLRAFNTAFLSMLLIMIGYSSYTLILIRSAANTPMDQNSPEDIFTLGTYLNREQYGTRPLLWGQGFDSEIEIDMAKGEYVYVDTSPIYGKVEKKNPADPDEYMIVEYNQEPVYIQTMFFPRMYSSRHAHLYESWIGDTISNTVLSTYQHPRTGQHYMVKVPTFIDNMSFFVNYQVNHMYWRYFLWNFVGRQNDIQGNGEIEYGNWVTGIKFIDDILIGGQDELPTEMKENKGYNVYFALPLILGIIGIVWQLSKGRKGKQQFWIVFMLFFMTGLAIVLYLNQTPNQPRERDYAYAGSFYAFAIWIGLGVAGIIEYIKRWTKKSNAVISGIVGAACLLVPLQMVSQTWDDHDRSGRTLCRDVGQNYLNSLSESGNPIVFTCGDNDTFPLWYNQEVEGEGTDARVCNLSYLHTDWYIDQMRRPAYDSPSLPITWERIDYAGNTNNVIYVIPIENIIEEYSRRFPEKFKNAFGDNPYDFNNITKYWILGADDPVKSEGRIVVEEIMALAQRVMDMGQREYGGNAFELPKKFIPTDKVLIPIDKEAVIRSGMKIPQVYDERLGGTMPEYMEIPLEGGAVYRRDLIIFDMLANANWVRPIYMSTTVGHNEYPAALQDFFISEGLAYRISPFNWTEVQENSIDIDKYYHNIMNRYKWGGVKENKDYYADETTTRMIYTHRNLITTLAIAMIQDGRPDADIIALLEKMRQEIPIEVIPYNAIKDNSVSARENYPSLLTVYSYLYSNQLDLKDSGDEAYIGDEQFNLLYKRMEELAESVVKNEYEYLNWYNHLDDRDRSEFFVCQRATILGDVLAQTGVDTFGDITGKQLFDVLYSGIEYEYNSLTNPDTPLTQEKFEYKIQAIYNLYGAARELNVSEADSTKLETLIYRIMDLVARARG